jgi:hypothetical protein
MTTNYPRRQIKTTYLGSSFLLIMSTFDRSNSFMEPNAYGYSNYATALPLSHLRMSENISASKTLSNFAYVHPSPATFETNFCLPQFSAYSWASYLTMPKSSLEMTIGNYAHPSTYSYQAVNSALPGTWSTNNLLTRDAQVLPAESTGPPWKQVCFFNLSFHGKSPTASS